MKPDNAMVVVSSFDDQFPAHVSDDECDEYAAPTFTREAANRVVEWTNQLAADDEGGFPTARWDGDTLILRSYRHPVFTESRIEPDGDGRYLIHENLNWLIARKLPALARPATQLSPAEPGHI